MSGAPLSHRRLAGVRECQMWLGRLCGRARLAEVVARLDAIIANLEGENSSFEGISMLAFVTLICYDAATLS